MKIEIMFENIKNKAVQVKENSVKFIREHKHEILEGTLCISVAMLSEKLIQKSQENGCFRCQNSTLKDEILSLQQKNQNLEKQVDNLKTICFEKDRIMDKTMSDGFRHGSPEAARQMSYKRHSLNL